MGVTGEVYQILKKKYILPILYNLFQKTEAERVPLSSFMRPALPHYQNETTTSQENYRPISLMNREAKILNKNMSKLNSTTYKMNYTLKSNGVYLMYVFPNSSFENQCNPSHQEAQEEISHVNRCRKNIWQKVKDPFMMETLSKLGREENFLNFVKNVNKNPTAIIILNSEKLEVFPLSSETR